MARNKPAPVQPKASAPPPAVQARAPAAQAHAPPPPPQAAPSAGPGMMGTMAAAAGGAIAGNAISNMMFGGRSQEGQQNQVQGQNQAQAPAQANPCAPQVNSFIQCVENAGNDVASCQYSWETVAQCRRSSPMWF